ncbi:MAG: hypothetical protein ABIY62_05875 [Ginsengibacter sp.]
MNKSTAFIIILLLAAITQPCVLNAQSKYVKWKNADDSLVMVRQRLSRWHPYGGLHLSSDAELYYLGPSFQAGVDFNVTRQLALSAYIHYFHTSANSYDNTGFDDKGRFKTFTSALLVQLDAGAGWYKGFFIGLGVALQKYSDRNTGNFAPYDEIRTTVTPAIRVGYSFPAGLHAISIEFNGTGPYLYSDGLYGVVTEAFTQVSLGGRFIF